MNRNEKYIMRAYGDMEHALLHNRLYDAVSFLSDALDMENANRSLQAVVRCLVEIASRLDNPSEYDEAY